MRIQEIIQVIEAVAPRTLQENYDNSGIQVGDINGNINGVLLCIDITEAVIDEAIELGAGLIISHHPLIFQGIKSLTGQNYIERIIMKAIKHNICLYSVHTNLDNALGGVNFEIATRLNLINVSILDQKTGIEMAAGSGIVGELADPMEYIDFLKHLKKVFKCGSIQYSTALKKNVKKVAVCGGSGSFLIAQAIKADADIFITGEIKYHDYFGNEDQIMLASIGHYESEQFTVNLIASIIKEKYPTFVIHFTKVNTNPINYL